MTVPIKSIHVYALRTNRDTQNSRQRPTGIAEIYG